MIIYCSKCLTPMENPRQQLRDGLDRRWHVCLDCGNEVVSEDRIHLIDAIATPGSKAATLFARLERIKARRKALPTATFGGTLRDLLNDEDVLIEIIEMLAEGVIS